MSQLPPIVWTVPRLTETEDAKYDGSVLHKAAERIQLVKTQFYRWHQYHQTLPGWTSSEPRSIEIVQWIPNDLSKNGDADKKIPPELVPQYNSLGGASYSRSYHLDTLIKHASRAAISVTGRHQRGSETLNEIITRIFNKTYWGMNWVNPDSGKYMVVSDTETLELYVARDRAYPEQIHSNWHAWLLDFVKAHEAATKKPGNAGKPW